MKPEALRLRSTAASPQVAQEEAHAIDAGGLAAALRSRIEGEVRFDDGSRALYATDGSNYRQVPIGVVLPKHADDVVETVALCRRYHAPILGRGGGTSLAGQCCNVAVVIDMSKYMNKILEIDPEQRLARVQPGVVLDDLRNAAEEYHLTFAPDPATHNHNTLGGMIGNNSCGVHSVMGGRTADNVHELEILTYDGLRLRVGATNEAELERIIASGEQRGELYARLRALRDRYAAEVRQRYPDIPRRVSGYNLDELLPEKGFHVARALVGSESTCVLVLEATLNLVYSPPARNLVVLGYPDVYRAGDHTPEVMEHKPVGCEGIDDRLISDMQSVHLNPGHAALLPEGGGWLLVEFGGADMEDANRQAHRMMERLKGMDHPPTMKLYDDEKQKKMVWAIRESGLGATAHVPAKEITWPGWEDSAVPPRHVGEYLRALRRLLEKYGYGCDLYGHFGQGCIHTRIDFDLLTVKGIANYRAFIEEAADLVLHFGGSLSGEHGDGQARGELLPKMYGADLVQAFREFKAIWDPQWRMNPGKVIDAFRADEHLRLGAQHAPAPVDTHFWYPTDRGNFPRAMLRCVGVAKCRKHSSGTMCPSYMVTYEEQHSTRGRARLLFEMLKGDVIKDLWRSEAVKEALDLCLSCKGCKGECPVNVDMATYKAEFLSHYYYRRLRPLSAYAFGRIDLWSRLASHMPRGVNFMTQARGARNVVKAMLGMPEARRIPRYAQQTFKDRFKARPHPKQSKRRVILWPDTFNNYFYPEIALAAVEVLEHLGYQVHVPQQHLCCGRPLYEFGMLNQAKRQLRQILDALRSDINAGVPVIGLEPSCVSVFRDELVNLFYDDMLAHRLQQQTMLLSEFLTQATNDHDLPTLNRRAIVHGHCHHKALMKMDSDQELLHRLGFDFEILDSGCCGMAGSFGFEKDKYEVSVKAGERVLLPAVRQAETDTLVIADGFSCREQIAQLTDRQALHLAEVIQLALKEQVVP